MLSVTCLIAWFMAARKLCFSPRDPNPAPLGADIWVFLNIFIIPVVCIMEPLVLQIVQPLRYYLRYLEKKRLGRKADTEVAMAPYPKDVGYASGGEEVTVIHIATNLGFRTPQINGDRSRLEVVLSCHSPVLDSVAIGLHYSDMLNLLLVSRTLRDAISARSREALGMASCVNGTKSECWGCRKQICIVIIHALPRPLSSCANEIPEGLQENGKPQKPRHHPASQNLRVTMLQMFL